MLSLPLFPPHTLPLLKHESFPGAAVLHELPHRGSPTGSALPANLLPCGLLSLHGARAPASSLLQCRLSTRSQPTSGIHLLWCGVLLRLQVQICSTVDLHGLQGHSLPHHGLHHGLQGNLCPSAWSSSSPPSSRTLVSAELFLSHRLTPLSCCTYAIVHIFFPEVLPPSLMGSALASCGSVLQLAGVGSVRHGGSF